MQIITIPPSRLDDYARVPIAFEVQTVFEVQLVHQGLGGIGLHEQSVEPYVKDYDELHSPLSWPARFDMKNWGLFLAVEAGGAPLGGAILARDTPGVDMLEGRRDLAVLWDLRVQPARRGQGVGAALFRHAAAWARGHGCVQLKIETQNTNVNACRFYAAQGARLGDMRRFAYRDDPAVAHEVQLNWYFDC